MHKGALTTLVMTTAWLTTAATTGAPVSAVQQPVVGTTPAAAAAPAAPPGPQEPAAADLYQFITHHATVHYVNTGVLGGLSRWRGGRPESICPTAVGLDPASDAFVTARLREVAAEVGAPLQTDPRCKGNVDVIFTPKPQGVMAKVLHLAAYSRGVRFPHQIDKQLALSATHPIQGWYLTASGGSAILNTDAALLGPMDLLPLWPLVIQSGLHDGGPGLGGIVYVILVIDTNAVAGRSLATLSDYAAMLALSVIQSPDHCDALPSILDLLSPGCGDRQLPAALTAGDLAFLRALYYHNTGLGPSLSRDDIQTNMMQQFEGISR